MGVQEGRRGRRARRGGLGRGKRTGGAPNGSWPGFEAIKRNRSHVMVDNCWICRIAHRSGTAHIVREDNRLLAFLDRGPVRVGHTLIVSKEHFPYFDEAPAEVVSSIVLLGQKLAVAMKRLYRVPLVAFLFTGSDIAHIRAHVVPMWEKTDVTSRRYITEVRLTFQPLPCPPENELAATAAALREALASG
jgi:histidine triad (HIT) family protein